MAEQWLRRSLASWRSSRTDASALGAALAMMEPLEARTFFSATPAATAAQLVAQANNDFAFDLLHKLSPDSSGNTFFSPYSVATALEMALQGANGVTASEIIQTLHLPSQQLAQAGIEALYQLFQATPATAGYTLSTANRLWVNANYPVLDSFLSASQSTFGADPQTLDFSDPQAAANTINAWVSDQTNGKITNLIPASDLGPYTGLVLTNAIYFKGNWADAFDPNLTQQAPFQISSTQASASQLMEQTNNFGYYAQGGPDGFQALDLPYVGSNLDMLVILPTTYDVAAFQSTLTPDLFSRITANLDTTDVDVKLPKFQLNETYDLIPQLKDLGIQTAFAAHQADFSGITPKPLFISDVVQKSFINVDETGTEAAAATGVVFTAGFVMTNPPPPVSFDADHPFLFAIRDTATNTILFLGSVADPSDGASDVATSPTPLSDSFAATVPTPPAAVTTNPLPVKTTNLSIHGVVDRKINGTVSVMHGIVSHVPKLADLTGTIDWGDNSSSPARFVRTGNKTIAVRGSHMYANAGSYAINIDVTQTPFVKGKPTTSDPLSMPSMSATASIAAARSPSRSTPATGLMISATARVPLTTTLATVDLPGIPAGATRGATIHWGDGSTSTGALTPNGAAFDITGGHVYHARGQFLVLIDVWQKSHGKRTILNHLNATADVIASDS